MSFEDLPEPEEGEHEHEYVQRCTRAMKLKNPDIPESQLQSMCTTKFRTTEDNLGRGVALKISGTGKKRPDGFMDLKGEIHGLDGFTRKLIKEEIDRASVAKQVITRIETLEDRMINLDTKISTLTHRFEELSKLKEVKELLEPRAMIPTTRLAHSMPKDHKIEYGLKPKLSVSKTKKRGQRGIVASPQPAEDKIAIGNKKRLRDFMPR